MRYDDGIVGLTPEQFELLRKYREVVTRVAMTEWVVCVETREVMDIRRAARRHKTHSCWIRAAAKFGARHRGVRWIRKGDPMPLRKNRIKVKAVVSDRGERWIDSEEAAKALGKAGRSTISEAIRSGQWCAGRRLWFEGERPRKPMWSGKGKPIVRVEDGVLFDTITHALGGKGTPNYHREHMRLTRAIRDRKPYGGCHYIHPSKQMLAYLASAAPTPQAGVA
jgi:hypothetical protein